MIVGHRQRTVRVYHGEQIADRAIGVTGDQCAGEGLAQQLIHRVIGEGDLIQVRCHTFREIIVAIILVRFDFAQRIGGADQPVPIIICEGGHLILRIFDREEIPIAIIRVLSDATVGVCHLLEPILGIVLELRDAVERVLRRGHVAGRIVGQRRHPVQGIGGSEQPAQGIVGERGGGIGWIERIARFCQQALSIVEESRDLVLRIRDRERIAFDVIRDVRLIPFGIGNPRHLIERGLIDKGRATAWRGRTGRHRPCSAHPSAG